MAQHNDAQDGTSFRWEQIAIPTAFEPEQALGGFLDEEPDVSDDGQLFPIYLQLTGSVADFTQAFSELLKSLPNFGDINLTDIVRSEIIADNPGDPGDYSGKGANENFTISSLDSTGESLDIIADRRFLALMGRAYRSDDPEVRARVDQVQSMSVGVPIRAGSTVGEGTAQPIRWTVDNETGNNSTDELAITAIIDDGIPLGHQLFRNNPADTRIEFAWIQDGLFQGGDTLPYGREFTKSDLDGFLTQSTGGTDEDAFYRLTGQADFGDLTPRNRLGFAATHGSHVGVIAAGYPSEQFNTGEEIVDPQKNPIITVQLPYETTRDTLSLALAPYLYQAVHYVFDRADAIARARNVTRISLVINFSFGFLTAPHDGTHPIEKFLDRMLAVRNAARPGLTEIVLPSGNSRELQCRARLELAPDETDEPNELSWRVLPDDQTLSYGILYLPPEHDARDFHPNNTRLELQLSTPDGLISPPIGETPSTAAVLRNADNRIVGAVIYQNKQVTLPDGADVFRGQFWFALEKTYHEGLDGRFIPPGNWPLIVTRKSELGGDLSLDAYIQRDDTQPGYATRGRQSYFDDPNYIRYTPTGQHELADNDNAYCKRDGTLNGIATGVLTTTVAGMIQYYPRWPLEPSGPIAAPYSAGGPDGSALSNVTPDIAKRSDISTVRWGRLTGGSRSGSWFRVSGTSIAAPFITRRIVHQMIAGTWTGKDSLLGWPVNPPSDPNQFGLEPKRIGLGEV